MLRWLLSRQCRLKLIVLLSGMFFLRMLLGQLSSSVELDVNNSTRTDDERQNIKDYDGIEHQRPLAKDDDPDRWFRYRPPVQSGVADQLGKRFDVETSTLSWNIDDVDFVNLTAEVLTQFVVATAASSFFYNQSLHAISTVQRHLPNHTIFFYDLEPKRKHPIAQTIEEVCDVVYRVFDFGRYPRHVQHRGNYAWKPLIIVELLTEYPGVLWIDSSIRFFSGNFTNIFHKAVESDGMLALTSTGHSNFAVTHPQMYSFLPTSKDGMIKTDQHEANCVLLYRTRPAFENVVWWWMLCALDPHCIAPTNRTNCDYPYRSRNVYANCHRFDQSALNILLANYFAFDHMRYFGSQIVAHVKREGRLSQDKAEARMCPALTTNQNFTTAVSKYRTS